MRSQGAYFEGDLGVIVLCTMFLVPCIFFNKSFSFPYYMAGYFQNRLKYDIFLSQMLQARSLYKNTGILIHYLYMLAFSR